jgi:hypothetical protein
MKKINPGKGWRLLKEGERIKIGDGYLHPHYDKWFSFECRPDLFRDDKEFAHTWPWRRRLKTKST